uniref:Hemolysin III n=1 Tax=Timspurckia oligopyrenoides TaxID=708627 RepID=A0A7S1ETY3_9RHOD|eukprot:CAMPEP_0182446856 /NCGR_PEP_ID=MMETSP1172-20130603/7590_1 /TAXON_ID=708627 /ORGANISM="Timspurckia oligopyrenoides, Strain CCMP3278" /LENGTH=440 /DNA_ID=CAMNT_0024642993 /DNA_START=30 /DNA_END=1352 /DNA_ORIENTATION=-
MNSMGSVEDDSEEGVVGMNRSYSTQDVVSLDDGLAAYARYRELCQHHGMEPNSSAAICLYTGSSTLSVSRPIVELELIPIVELLGSGDANFVTELNLSGARLSSSAASLIAVLLSKQDSKLETLNLSRNSLREEGALKIVGALRKNESLKKLNLSSNKINPMGAFQISRMISSGFAPGLKELLVDNNNMEQRGVDVLSPVCEDRSILLSMDGNHVLAEILNGLTHGVGLIGSLVAGTGMIREAAANELHSGLLGSVVLFVFALCMMYSSSCLYHSFFRLGRVKRALRVMDHCCIFLLIASTYTPFLLRYIWSSHLYGSSMVGPIMFYLVWGFALAGIVMSSGVLRRTPSRNLRASLALCMGWIVVSSMKILWERMPSQCLLLIVLGGMFYTVGVPFYIKGREVSIYHVVWHLAIMFGASSHYAGILFYVVRNSGNAMITI